MTEYKHTQERLDEIEMHIRSHDLALAMFSDKLRVLAEKIEQEIVVPNESIEKMEQEGHVREKK